MAIPRRRPIQAGHRSSPRRTFPSTCPRTRQMSSAMATVLSAALRRRPWRGVYSHEPDQSRFRAPLGNLQRRRSRSHRRPRLFRDSFSVVRRARRQARAAGRQICRDACIQTQARQIDRGRARDRRGPFVRASRRHLRKCRRSHIFANFQSRLTVSRETFKTSAVSSTLSPPKKRSSTTRLLRSST